MCISYHVGGTSTFLNELLPKSNTIKDTYHYFISKENNNPTAMIKNINYNMIILNGYTISKNAKGTNFLIKRSFVRKIDNKINNDNVFGGKFRAAFLEAYINLMLILPINILVINSAYCWIFNDITILKNKSL